MPFRGFGRLQFGLTGNQIFLKKVVQYFPLEQWEMHWRVVYRVTSIVFAVITDRDVPGDTHNIHASYLVFLRD